MRIKYPGLATFLSAGAAMATPTVALAAVDIR